MRHLVKGRKLKRTASHRKALMANLAMSLFEHKKIVTTEAKAKELRPYAEHLITKAKNALLREKQGLLDEGQTIDVHSRRIVARVIRQKPILQELFDAIAPVVESRNGGYTRIVKLGFRRGDAGKKAMIELIDWANPQDGTVSMKTKKKAKKVDNQNNAASAAKVTPAPVATKAPVVEPAAVVDEVIDTQAEIIETPVAEVAPSEETPTASEKPVFDDTADTEENKA